MTTEEQGKKLAEEFGCKLLGERGTFWVGDGDALDISPFFGTPSEAWEWVGKEEIELRALLEPLFGDSGSEEELLDACDKFAAYMFSAYDRAETRIPVILTTLSAN